MSKEIQLTQGKVAIVDDEDYEWLSQWKWYAVKSYNMFYAVRNITKPGGKQTLILMHRVILGLEPGDPQLCDHKNHTGLDNRRDNLRICNNSQNHQNECLRRNHSSAFKGVSWRKSRNKWRALIGVDGKQKHLGYFNSEIEAVKAYDESAKIYFGEFACINLL